MWQLQSISSHFVHGSAAQIDHRYQVSPSVLNYKSSQVMQLLICVQIYDTSEYIIKLYIQLEKPKGAINQNRVHINHSFQVSPETIISQYTLLLSRGVCITKALLICLYVHIVLLFCKSTKNMQEGKMLFPTNKYRVCKAQKKKSTECVPQQSRKLHACSLLLVFHGLD